MSFWVWVGVAIVALLLWAFVRDRRRRAARGEGDGPGRLEGRDAERDPHEGEIWGGGWRWRWGVTCVRHTDSIRQALTGVSAEHQQLLAVGVPARGEEVRTMPEVRSKSTTTGLVRTGRRVGKNLLRMVCPISHIERCL